MCQCDANMSDARVLYFPLTADPEHSRKAVSGTRRCTLDGHIALAQAQQWPAVNSDLFPVTMAVCTDGHRKGQKRKLDVGSVHW